MFRPGHYVCYFSYEHGLPSLGPISCYHSVPLRDPHCIGRSDSSEMEIEIIISMTGTATRPATDVVILLVQRVRCGWRQSQPARGEGGFNGRRAERRHRLYREAPYAPWVLLRLMRNEDRIYLGTLQGISYPRWVWDPKSSVSLAR